MDLNKLRADLWAFVMRIYESPKAFYDIRSEVGVEAFSGLVRASHANGLMTMESRDLALAGKCCYANEEMP